MKGEHIVIYSNTDLISLSLQQALSRDHNVIDSSTDKLQVNTKLLTGRFDAVTVLVAEDYSENCQAAKDVAAKFRQRFKGQVKIVTISNKWQDWGDVNITKKTEGTIYEVEKAILSL